MLAKPKVTKEYNFRGQEDDPKAMWDSLKKALLNHVTSQLIGECITKQSG